MFLEKPCIVDIKALAVLFLVVPFRSISSAPPLILANNPLDFEARASYSKVLELKGNLSSLMRDTFISRYA